MGSVVAAAVVLLTSAILAPDLAFAPPPPPTLLSNGPGFSFTGYAWGCRARRASCLTPGHLLPGHACGDVGLDLASKPLPVERQLSVRIGYRAIYVDDREGDFLYDATMHGPIIAATYRF